MVLGKRKVESATKYVQFEAPSPSIPKDKVLLQTTQTQMCALLDQITWLMHHSNDVFCEVLQDANKTYERIMNLANRVTQFSELVPQVEAYLEACTTDTLLGNPRQTDFKTKTVEDSQLLTPETRPQAITDVYERSKLPPNLSIMDPLSEDPEPCIKKYTNPAFFIEQWVMEQRKQHEEARKKRDARRKERKEKPTQVAGRNQQKKVVQQVQLRRKQLNAMGKEFSSPETKPASGTSVGTPRGSQQTSTPRGQQPPPSARTTSQSSIAVPAKPSPSVEKIPSSAQAQPQPPSQPQPQPPSQPQPQSQQRATAPSTPQPTQPQPTSQPQPQTHAQPRVPQHAATPVPPTPATPAPPAPPVPAPPAPVAAVPSPPAPAPPQSPAAPAPPPPPPAQKDLASSAGLSLAERLAAKKGALQQAPTEQTKAPVDKKSALLEQIRIGGNLKKVERHEDTFEEKKAASGPAGVAFDVAKIMARRDAIMEMSDSDEEEGGWDD